MKLRDDFNAAMKRLNERAEKIARTEGYTRHLKKLRLLLELIKEQTPK